MAGKKRNNVNLLDIENIFTYQNEKEHIMYGTESRLSSFKDWPFDSESTCNPTTLAEAGFYHIPTSGAPDAVRCFVCFKELDGWEWDDCPRSEHKKHSPHCAFLKLEKPILDLTVDEFLDLECERQKNKLRKYYHAKKQLVVDQAKNVRAELAKLNKK